MWPITRVKYAVGTCGVCAPCYYTQTHSYLGSDAAAGGGGGTWLGFSSAPHLPPCPHFTESLVALLGCRII